MNPSKVYWDRRKVENPSSCSCLDTEFETHFLIKRLVILEDNLMSLFFFQVYEHFESRTPLFP